ncbi:MAG: TolC family protein [Balneolaceae bacterium]|nr:TolC family protein [Balneolaceae bacterium]
MMLLTIVTLLVISIPTRAQETENIPSPLDQYLLQAAENNPSLRADYQNYLSGLEKVPQVKTLPDPELSFGYFISPIETRVGPQQARFGLTQMFPWFGTLNARGDAAAKMAQARFESFQEARNRLFYEVQKKWYRLYHIDQNIDILRENVSILETFESLAIRRYEAGQVGQVDVLRVQIEKEDLKTRFELMNDNRKVALKEFRELLNSDSDEHIKIADSLQSRDLELSVPELEQRIMRQNAQLSSLDYQVSSAKSSFEAARKEGLPKFGLGMDYIVTGERDMVLTDNGKDAILARAGIQIPLYRKKYRAKEKQAEIELQSVQHRQTAAQNRLYTQLGQAMRDYEDARRRVSLYKDVQIQRTRQAINILTEEYATSATDFEELLRLQRKLLDYELARETALVDQNTAVAYIEYLYGRYNIDPEEI